MNRSYWDKSIPCSKCSGDGVIKVFNGIYLKNYRKVFNFTQTDFASRLNIAQTTLSNIETGYHQPGKEVLDSIIRETGHQ